MTDRTDNIEDETRSLVVAVTDFLRDQLITRTDLVPEDKDCLEIAIQSLEIAYGLEGSRYLQYRFSRPLMDIFNQVTNPVSVKDKIRADAHKEAGNDYMRRRMFENAEVEYTHAIELDKWNSIYYCNRASSRNEQHNFFEGIADCRQALMLNPDYAKAHARMGQAYALLHRPREAARCYRQALEMEPENERYRNNLRVAENQIDTPDVAQVITNLLGSLFGIGPQNTEDRSSRRLPPSFMIITESHPPTQGANSQITETAENGERLNAPVTTSVTRNGEHENEPALLTNSNGRNISFPQPFGVVDEGAEEQPLTELQQSTEAENRENEVEEFVINIPLISFEFIPPTHFSTLESESTTENATRVDESSTKNIKNSEETSLPQQEIEEIQNGVQTTNALENQDVSSIIQTSDHKQKNNQSKKEVKQPSVQVHDEKPDILNSVEKEEASNKEHLSNNVVNEHESGTSKNSNNNSNVSPSTEKSQNNHISSEIRNQHTNNNNIRADRKPQNPFIFGSNKNHVEKSNAIKGNDKNEESKVGETSEKQSSFEEDVD